MFTTTARSESINPTTRSEHIGIAVSRGGAIIVGQYFTIDPANPIPPGETAHRPEMSSFITCTGTGTIVFQYYDGNHDRIDVAVPGFFYPVRAIRVVTSFTFTNGGLITTNATGLHWYGGV